MARVVSINLSEKKGTVKNPVKEGTLIENFGFKQDAHSGDWHRQVSLLAIESINKMIESGAEGLTPGIFAENITTEGLELFSLPLGTKFKINDVILELTQIGKECHGGCEIKKKVGHCVMPHEGIFTKVLKGGIISENDVIEIME